MEWYMWTFILIAFLSSLIVFIVFLAIKYSATMAFKDLYPNSPSIWISPELQKFTEGHCDGKLLHEIPMKRFNRKLLYFVPTDVKVNRDGNIKKEDFPRIQSLVVRDEGFIPMRGGHVPKIFCFGINDGNFSLNNNFNNMASEIVSRINNLSTILDTKERQIKALTSLTIRGRGGEVSRSEMKKNEEMYKSGYTALVNSLQDILKMMTKDRFGRRRQ